MISCKNENCNEKSQSRGYCQKHYVAARAKGEFGFRECIVDTCSKNATSKGLCPSHYIKIYYSEGDIIPDSRFKGHEGLAADNPKEYRSWQSMKTRCYNEKYRSYSDYGGRGIRMCDGMRHEFKYYMEAIGKAPSSKHSLDRIDNTKNYTCGLCDECKSSGYVLNCKWSTANEQNNNRRNIKKYLYNGQSLTLTQLAAEIRMNPQTLRNRLIKYKWTLEKSISRPVK